MPFFPDLLDEQDQQNPNNNGQDTMQLTDGGGGSTIEGSGNASNPNAANKASSTGFTNINRYLEENKPQSQELSGQVAGQIDNTVDQANTSISDTSTGVDNYFNQNLPQDNGIVNEALQDPTTFVTDQDKLDEFRRVRDSQYTGVDNFNQTNFFQPVNDAIDDANRYADIQDNQQTRTAALEDVQENDSRGITSLNNLFLQNDPNSRETLSASVDRIDPLQGNYQQVVDNFNTTAQNADQTASNQRAAVTQAFDQPINDFRTDINTRTTAADKEINDLLDAYYASIGDEKGVGNVSPAMQQAMQIIADRKAANDGRIFTGRDVASDSELAREMALQELLGNNLDIIDENANRVSPEWIKLMFGGGGFQGDTGTPTQGKSVGGEPINPFAKNILG